MSIIDLSEVCPITKPGVGFENPLNPQLFGGEVGVGSEDSPGDRALRLCSLAT